QFLTDLVSFQSEMLSHHEGLRGLVRKTLEAFLKSGEEPLLVERRLGGRPSRRHLDPVAALVEQGVELVRAGGRRLAARTADRVDDLVLEDAGQPGAQAGALAEAGL